MAAHVTSFADPQVIVVGMRVDNVWHYMKSEPMTYAEARAATRNVSTTPDTVAFFRAADDPEVADYATR